MDKIKKALNIASRDLRACYGRQGIYAGLHHFKNYWARDSSFASLGSLELEDYEIVKNNLILYLNNITKFGQLPFRVGPNMVLNYFGLDKKRTPRYHNDKGDKKTIDQNSLLIISFYNYIKKTNDFEFLKKYIHRIESALMWNFKCDINKDLLLEEHEYCNWADSIKKKGSVFMPYEDRREILRSLGFVDDIIPCIDEDETVCKTLTQLKPDIFAKGGDWDNKEIPEIKICEELNIQVLKSVGKTIISNPQPLSTSQEKKDD